MNKNDAEAPLPGAMPGRTPENAPQRADFAPIEVAKALLRGTRSATLATIDRNTGHPFASLVNVATDADGAPLILVSRLATHTANLEIDGRASLVLASFGKGDALAHPRLTVLGTFEAVAPDSADEPRLRRRFLARQPKSKLYAGFADFAFWRMGVVSAHLNGGFARAADLTAADIVTDVSDAAALIEAEEGAVAHMNDDHAEACRLYATKLLGAAGGDWRCTGLAPDGIELQNGSDSLWLPFPHRVTGPGPLRAVLKQLADEARMR
jgi:putative heme iron utilization protein